MKKGFFIVLEGTDGSGKATQTALLKKRFEKTGQRILVGDFPRYETSRWGELVGQFLRGEFGKLEDVDPHLAILPYMIDEYTWSRDVAKPWVEQGGIILSNRYFTANVHQIAKKRGRVRSAYREWIWTMGYKELGILRPDLVLFLDVPPQISKRLIRQKSDRSYLGKKRRDIAEWHVPHQIAAHNAYLEEVRKEPWWVRISCMTKGKLDSAEEIHEGIWKTVNKILRLSLP